VLTKVVKKVVKGAVCNDLCLGVPLCACLGTWKVYVCVLVCSFSLFLTDRVCLFAEENISPPNFTRMFAPVGAWAPCDPDPGACVARRGTFGELNGVLMVY
jgi:hypothetical protein